LPPAESGPLQKPEPLYGTAASLMKRVYVAQNQVDAQLVADQLRASGIDAVVKMDTVAIPSMPFPSVWVDDDDLAQAKELLADRSDSPESAV
jgi:Putative prokaryotic signal transducing protein